MIDIDELINNVDKFVKKVLKNIGGLEDYLGNRKGAVIFLGGFNQ
jgi:hypothetical protein